MSAWARVSAHSEEPGLEGLPLSVFVPSPLAQDFLKQLLIQHVRYFCWHWLELGCLGASSCPNEGVCLHSFSSSQWVPSQSVPGAFSAWRVHRHREVWSCLHGVVVYSENSLIAVNRQSVGKSQMRATVTSDQGRCVGGAGFRESITDSSLREGGIWGSPNHEKELESEEPGEKNSRQRTRKMPSPEAGTQKVCRQAVGVGGGHSQDREHRWEPEVKRFSAGVWLGGKG